MDLICPKCKGTNINTTDSYISGQQISLCKECGNLWYHEKISVKLDNDGTPMIELDAPNPFEAYFISQYPIFSFFKIFFQDDDEKK